jgi:hypothetical protein
MSLATARGIERVGPSVVLGAGSDNPTLLLGFAPIWRGARVESAFLVLEPLPAAAAGDDVPLEVLRVQNPWASIHAPGQRQSLFALPKAHGIGRPLPGMAVRLDVTEIVRYLARNPERDHGFAVRAGRDVQKGLTISTGLGGAPAPRLDVYVE